MGRARVTARRAPFFRPAEIKPEFRVVNLRLVPNSVADDDTLRDRSAQSRKRAADEEPPHKRRRISSASNADAPPVSKVNEDNEHVFLVNALLEGVRVLAMYKISAPNISIIGN